MKTTKFFTSAPGLTGTPLMMVDSNHDYKKVCAMDSNQYRMLELDLLANDKARFVLNQMRHKGIHNTNERINLFINCNFGNLDHTPDIDAAGTFHFENVKCPYKAANMACPHGTDKPYCIKKY